MLLFGVCFFLYFIKLSAGKGYCSTILFNHVFYQVIKKQCSIFNGYVFTIEGVFTCLFCSIIFVCMRSGSFIKCLESILFRHPPNSAADDTVEAEDSREDAKTVDKVMAALRRRKKMAKMKRKVAKATKLKERMKRAVPQLPHLKLLLKVNQPNKPKLLHRLF